MLMQRVAALDPAVRRQEEETLLALAPTLPGFEQASTILLFASTFPEEIPTAALLQQVRCSAQRLLLPRVDRAARRLVLLDASDPHSTLSPGVLGIPEPSLTSVEVPPELVDWVLVPGLGFDTAGYRLGRGGGYYDRLLPHLRPDAPRWALALTPQRVAQLPVEPHDQPLHGVAFADQILTFL
jgi:5-formyltetrahydrofolate cyclo-ligase